MHIRNHQSDTTASSNASLQYHPIYFLTQDENRYRPALGPVRPCGRVDGAQSAVHSSANAATATAARAARASQAGRRNGVGGRRHSGRGEGVGAQGSADLRAN